ncbi:hypothetical protein HFP43_01370 [Streptomyces sp. SJ1-7]|nr:hypothetical protein [Streptomyces sp. SJ1-7]
MRGLLLRRTIQEENVAISELPLVHERSAGAAARINVLRREGALAGD